MDFSELEDLFAGRNLQNASDEMLIDSGLIPVSIRRSPLSLEPFSTYRYYSMYHRSMIKLGIHNLFYVQLSHTFFPENHSNPLSEKMLPMW